jgi:GTP cyclohydrolase I
MREVLKMMMPEERWDSEHMARTPERFLRMMEEMTNSEPHAFEFTSFKSDSSEMVVIGEIGFTSLCAHHLAPFIGHAHVAYVPDGRIAGLSKFARTVRFMSKGLWTQEELTTEIVNFLEEQLNPQGIAVIMTAEHFCMTIRGVQAPGTKTTTSAMRGVFLDPGQRAREEFLSLIGAK